MLKHYFKVAIRLIKRSFLFSSINMLGFVFGMTAAFLIYLWVLDELTFEDFNKNRDSIYRMVTMEREAGGRLKESTTSVAPLSEAFRKNFPQVANATFIKYESKRPLRFGANAIEAMEAYVDTAFFDVFSFPVVAGDPNLIKKDPDQVVLSEPVARKLFGKTSPIGKKIESLEHGRTRYFKVAAVLKVPRKSHIQFEILRSQYAYPFPMDWKFTEWIQSYVQLKENAVLTATDRKAMGRVLADHTGRPVMQTFQPLNDIHLNTRFKDPFVENYGSKSQIYLFLALSVLVIFMGAFNFTTLSTARASMRFKEIGVRKVTGAKRKTLILQFLSESMVQAFLSLLLALALTELLLPLFNRMMEKDMVLQLNWQVVLFVFVGIFVIGCMAGSFPAFYMSSLSPLLAFKGGKATGKKGTLIRALVCVQFVIAIAMILCTSIVFKQLHYLQNANLGLDKENIVSVEAGLWYDVDNYKQEVLKNPNVKSVAMGVPVSDYLKGHAWEGRTVEWYKEDGSMDSLRMINIFGDGDFARTFGLELVKGKFPEEDAAAYWNGTYEFPALINETAWKMMKVENPLGIQLIKGVFGWNSVKIVGVVKDFNFQSLREKVKPAYIYFNPESFNRLHIKMAPEHKSETLKFLKEQYEKMRPGKVFTYQFFTDALNLNYAREQQQSRMFLIFTILAILIAMMGVFGLVALSTAQRTKEIGIRKVTGAHSDRIVKMFCVEYLRSVGVAFLIACPVGYLFMSRWLSDFAYQTAISWWLFPVAGLIIALITLATVVAQTWHAASQNPVSSLRYE